MGKFVWLGLGIFLGFCLAAVVGVAIIDVFIPWGEICPILGPAQRLAEAGSGLIADLQAWLARAESLLETGSSNEASEEARAGFAGILDRAGEIAGDVRDRAVDVVTAPLEALIDLGQDVLGSVQEAVDAARDVMATIEDVRCE